MPHKAPATAGPRRHAGTLGGFPPPPCGDFNLPPSRLRRAEHPDTADQPAALFGDVGFMLENAPGMPAYFQSDTESALDLAWPRDVGVDSRRTNRTADSKHKFPTSAITPVRGTLLTPSTPTFPRCFTARNGQIEVISELKHEKLRDRCEKPLWTSTKHRSTLVNPHIPKVFHSQKWAN
ncbi:hypothetical protein IOCL2690_000099200 [Leishmania lindenbergi]|uniref:Uncharacterized protein n=1 Tax=Leishmania lindenbergi TaxID=651832 RepID=A0AAW3AV01_9TRYP